MAFGKWLGLGDRAPKLRTKDHFRQTVLFPSHRPYALLSRYQPALSGASLRHHFQ